MKMGGGGLTNRSFTPQAVVSVFTLGPSLSHFSDKGLEKQEELCLNCVMLSTQITIKENQFIMVKGAL
jgi:hypothetical protein